MIDATKIIEKAKHSRFYLWLLNRSLSSMIPFNKPHKFEVVEIGSEHLKTKIPYIHRNHNHIKGLHACALATAAEFTTGFLLLTKLDAKKYRVIMQQLQMEYHYQGKMDAYATFSISDSWLEQYICQPLSAQNAVVVMCEIKIYDLKENHLATGKIQWQIKDWQKVKTKLS